MRLAALALGVVALVSTAGSALGGFSGTINGIAANLSSATTVLQSIVTGGSGACTSTGAGTSTAVNSVNCPDSVLPSGTVAAAPSTTSKSVTINNLSTPNASTPTISVTSCGLQSISDSGAANNSGIIHGTVTYGAAGALTGGSGLSFAQASNTYGATVTPVTNPSNFSIVGWFNMPATTSVGTILGFTDSHTNSAQTTSDRSLWLQGRRINWGVINNGTKQVVTSATNLTAGWHFVAATVGATTQTLYVDNQAVVSSAFTSTSNYTGYWHIGWGDETGWSNVPSNMYWPGTLDNIAVIPGQLSAAQVANLYAQTTDAAEVNAITALNPTNFWKLNDTASNLYTGNVPTAGPQSWQTDASGNGNTLINPGSSVTWTSSGGPLGGAAYATFSGSNYLTSTTQYVNPQGWTVSAYFKTGPVPGGSGPIFEFSNTQLQSPTQWDRHVWIDATGHLVFGVYPGAVKEVTSTGTYADNTWHQVTASSGAAGMKLYVDGTLVASDATVTTSEVTTGWWHLGWGNMRTGWTNPPTNSYWTGGIGNVAIFNSQLSNAQVATFAPAAATTQSAFASAISALTPIVFWPMQSATGVSTSACQGILASVQVVNGTTTSCAYPAGSGACGTPSLSLTGLSTPANLTAGATQTVTLTLAKSGVPASLNATHAFANVRFSLTTGSFSALLNHTLSGSMDL